MFKCKTKKVKENRSAGATTHKCPKERIDRALALSSTAHQQPDCEDK
jgi:hypothetical protein